MPVSKCTYNHLEAVGSFLRKPQFNLGVNILKLTTTPQSLKIRDIGLIVLTPIVIIPTSILWAAGKTITCLSRTSLNEKNLHLAPAPFAIPDTDELKDVDIMKLYTRFKELFPFDKNKGALLDLCEKIKDNDLYRTNPQPFYPTLNAYLRGIQKQIELGEVSLDKQRDILMELAEASSRCEPTWLEVAGKLYREIKGKQDSLDGKILDLVQTYKEDLIIDFCQNTLKNEHWHGLNVIRNILGDELGLNKELNVSDPYADVEMSGLKKAIAKGIFLHKYRNVNNLISRVQSDFNKEPYNQLYFDRLVEIAKELGIKDPSEFVQEQCFDEENEYKITRLGMTILLRGLGIIKK